MSLNDVRVGFALTGSHCTIEQTIPQIERLVKAGAEVLPIVSDAVKNTDTRFGQAQHWITKLKQITGNNPISKIVEAELVGPKGLVDIMVLAPCTGNTLAKLASGITDGTVLMAAKSHLRNLRPVVIAISTNDGLGLNIQNLGLLINLKHVYMVPFGQDSPVGKPNSLRANLDLILDTIKEALQHRQLQPVMIAYPA